MPPSNPSAEEQDGEEYEYTVNVSALETFRNHLEKNGVGVTEVGNKTVFTAWKRLNMKALKERGTIRSYSIVRLRRHKQLVEEG